MGQAPAQEPLSPLSLSRPSVSQSWAEITSQTEGLSRLLRQHAEDLNSGPLSKLGLLIRERQQLRKAYSEQWQQLQQELSKVGACPAPRSRLLPPRAEAAGLAREPLDPRGKWKSLTAGRPSFRPSSLPLSWPEARPRCVFRHLTVRPSKVPRVKVSDPPVTS